MLLTSNSRRNWWLLLTVILLIAAGACVIGFSTVPFSSIPASVFRTVDRGAFLKSKHKALNHNAEGNQRETVPEHLRETATNKTTVPDSRNPPKQPDGNVTRTSAGRGSGDETEPRPFLPESGSTAGTNPGNQRGQESGSGTRDASGSGGSSQEFREEIDASRVFLAVTGELNRTLRWLEGNTGRSISPKRTEVVPLPGLELSTGRVGENTLLVVPRDEVGRGRPMCTDGLFVQVMSEDGVRTGGEVTCETTCEGATCADGARYRVTYWLPRAGVYNVTVRTTGTLLSAVCFEYGDERGLVATMNMTVPWSSEATGSSSGRHDVRNSAVGNVLQRDVTGSSSETRPGVVSAPRDASGHDATQQKEGRGPRLRRRRDVTVAVPAARDVTDACSPELFYRGRFETVQSRFALRKSDVDVTWRPSGDAERCDWPAYWSDRKARRCLAGKWIFIFGDSTLEEIAVELMRGVFGSFNESWNHPRANCAGHKFESQRIWDTGFISPTLPRVTFYWIGNGDPCVNGGGLESFDHPGVQADLRAFFGHDWMDPMKARKVVDLLIINSGLHDLSNRMPFNFAQYFTRLDKTLSSLSRIAHTPVWKTTSPKFKRYTCRGSQGTQPYVEVMNRAATPLARAHGFQIADQYAMSVAYPEQSDGHHCRSRSSCQNFGASLLNFACRPRA